MQVVDTGEVGTGVTETGDATTVAGTIGVAMTGVLHVSACSLSSTQQQMGSHSASPCAHKQHHTCIRGVAVYMQSSAQLCFTRHGWGVSMAFDTVWAL
jgi:hypothetical protein